MATCLLEILRCILCVEEPIHDWRRSDYQEISRTTSASDSHCRSPPFQSKTAQERSTTRTYSNSSSSFSSDFQESIFGKSNGTPSAEKPQATVDSLVPKDVRGTQVLKTQHGSSSSSSPFPSLTKPDTQKLIYQDIMIKCQPRSSAQTNANVNVVSFLSNNVKGPTMPVSESPSFPIVPKPGDQRLILHHLGTKHQSLSSDQTNATVVSLQSNNKKGPSVPLVSSTPCSPIPKLDGEKLIYIDLGEKHQSSSSTQRPSFPSVSPSPSSPALVPKADAKKVFTFELKYDNEPLVSSPSSSGLDSPKKSVKDSKRTRIRKSSLLSPHKVPNVDPASPSSRAESPGSAPVLKRKVTVPVFKIPGKLKHELENGKIPGVLLKPLSQFTYCDFFAALLYAEDYYYEKWSEFLLHGVTLEIRKEPKYFENKRGKNVQNYGRDEKIYVVFEIDSVPEKRPYLLSRDFVKLKPLDKHVKPFEGTISFVVKSRYVYAEFGSEFISQHFATCKYDVSFSFNRVCLKRCHLALRAATEPTYRNFLFPDQCQMILDVDEQPLSFNNRGLNDKEKAAVYRILSLWCPPPFLLVGSTAKVICEAVLQIYRADKQNRILLASPLNKTCDFLMQSLSFEIPDHEKFRANAAFRGVEDVPEDILGLSSYNSDKECFTMSTLTDLRRFRIISTTYMSSFRLYNEGINSGHFSHVFLVDASSAIEPEVLVTLVNLVDDMTAVVVTGCPGHRPNRIRSEISRGRGLRKSYMHRLLESNLYSDGHPSFVLHL